MLRITTEDADALLGTSVKEAGKTPAGLQALQDSFVRRMNEAISIDGFSITTADGTRVIGFHSEIP